MLCVLKGPVEIIELNLDKIERTLVSRQELFKELRSAMEGEAEAFDFAFLLHLQHIRKNVILLALIVFHGPLRDVVKEVEIEIVRPAFAKRDIEQRNIVDGLCQRVAGELVSDIVALTRVAGQGFRHSNLRLSAQIGIGCVKIVHTLSDCQVEHRIDLCLVNFTGSGIGCKSHTSESKLRQFFTVEK